MQSYHFKKSLATSFFRSPLGRGWGNAPQPQPIAYFLPLAVKAKASAVFFFGKTTKKKPVGLDGL